MSQEKSTISLECTNCGAEWELPENLSVERLDSEAKAFFERHTAGMENKINRRIKGNASECEPRNIFIRTFKYSPEQT